MLLFFLLVGCAWGQVTQLDRIGSPPTPQIRKQVQLDQAASAKARIAGFTRQEFAEFNKLHEADAIMLHKILEGRVADIARYKALEALVEAMPEASNTRVITEMHDDLKGLLQREKVREENTQRWQDRMWSWVIGSALGIASLITGLLLARYRLDPKRRDAARLKIDNAADLRTADVVGRLEDVKQEVVHTHRDVAVTREAVGTDLEDLKGRIRHWSGESAEK